MNYRGYKIEREKEHYKIIPPQGEAESWTEDSIKDAKEAIDAELLMNADE